MGLLFHFNFEMEVDFFVFQPIFVCFVIRSVPYSFPSLSRSIGGGPGGQGGGGGL